jgi:hypothetical protein
MEENWAEIKKEYEEMYRTEYARIRELRLSHKA